MRRKAFQIILEQNLRSMLRTSAAIILAALAAAVIAWKVHKFPTSVRTVVLPVISLLPVDADLLEQRRMADAAEGTLWWTQLQFFTGAAGLMGLLYSLYLTRGAVLAAQAQVMLSREAMTTTERAYVAYDGCNWTSHIDEGSGEVFWRIRINWINVGNTPTRNLAISISAVALAQPMTDNFVWAEPNDWGRFYLRPDGTMASGPIDISGAELLAIKLGKKQLYVRGIARYRDVFADTEKHSTIFCVRATNITGDPTLPYNSDRPFHIDFVFTEKDNSQDDA